MTYAGLTNPYEGGHPETIDDSLAREGVTEVVRLPGGVAVIGASVGATQAAKNKLKVTWSAALTATYDSERALTDYASSRLQTSFTALPTAFAISAASTGTSCGPPRRP
jgi:isoquinoline 1-oxidoreductase beta subunit